MPAAAPAFADLRSAIDPEHTYIVQMDDGSGWSRPADAEHAHLTGVDVLHAVRRGMRAYHAELAPSPNGIVTLTSGNASIRFIPQRVYKDTFCATENCEESTNDGEEWDGRCGNCVDRASATEETVDPAKDATPAALPAGTPYTQDDLRHGAATAYQMVLYSLDTDSGVGEGIGDHTIPSTAGTATERTWSTLGEHASVAYRAMYELIDTAPDLSRWAIDMAADHLTPDPEQLTRRQNNQPAVSIHLSFASHITDDQRTALRQALLLSLHAAL
ncbi:hypothetical protein ACWEQL_00310 [Kitasatospora sp. NPDC004240]